MLLSNDNPVYNAIIVFLLLMTLIILIKPSIINDDNEKENNKSYYPLLIIGIIIAILIYVIFAYFIPIDNNISERINDSTSNIKINKMTKYLLVKQLLKDLYK